MSDSEIYRRVYAAIGKLLSDDWSTCVAQWSPSHPAARGCLLELVRDAWGEQVLFIEHVVTGPSAVGWRPVMYTYDHAGFPHRAILCSVSFETEDEALVATLEAAPS